MDWGRASQGVTAKFGFAFLDAAAGKYFVGSVMDDDARANLSAMLTQVNPGKDPRDVNASFCTLGVGTLYRLLSQH